MKKIIQKLANKAICAAFVVLGAFAASAELVKTPILQTFDDVTEPVSVGYKVTGLNDGKEEAVVFTNHLRTATWTVPANLENVQFLVVGGGGGAGGCCGDSAGAGGGGGAVITGIVEFTKNDKISVTVGKGGTGGVKDTTSPFPQGGSPAQTNAEATYFKVNGTECVKALGGGGDQGRENIGGNGGSNAGNRGRVTTIQEFDLSKRDGDINTELVKSFKSYAHKGGVGFYNASVKSPSLRPSAGGGGATEDGGDVYAPITNKNATVITYTAGKGGEGLKLSITGTETVYGSGGGGGITKYLDKNNKPVSGYDWVAGKGGTGAGNGVNQGNGGDATANKGGGGGGSAYGTGGNGGSGIVVFRYALPAEVVAKIGDAEYASISDAVSAAVAGDIIKLEKDIALDETLVIPADKTVTLDLNGKQITSGYQQDSTTKHIYPFDVYGTFTIEDTVGNGSITGRGILVQVGAKLTIESGSIYAIDSNGGSALFMHGGDVVINGGHIEQNAEGTYNFAINGNAGTVTMNNGWVGGNHGAIAAGGATVVINGGTLVCTGTVGMTDNVLYSYDTGSITINGGTFIGDSDTAAGGCCVYDANGGATINGGTFGNTSGGDVWGTTGTTIKGGTFSNLIETQHIAAGYKLNADGQVVTAKPVVAQIGETKYATLSEAFAAVTDDAQTVTILKDVTENLTGAYLRGNITTENDAKVTINLTNSDWLYCPYTFVLGANVTLKCPALFYYAGGAQINGKLIVDAYYQMYAGTKLTINEPGSMTVTTEQFYLRYTDGDANAGIYINGDNDDSTIGLNTSVIYFYQGMINAKNANIKTSVYWQTNETDGQGSANLVLDNSKLNITVNEQKVKATGNSTVTLTNGSELIAPGGFEVGGVLKSSCDITGAISKISDLATIEISGGTYTQDVSDWCVDGYAAVKTLDNKYVVSAMPTATVSNLGSITVGLGDYTANAYMMYDIINGGKLQEATVPYDLTLAMDFKAKDTAETAAQNAFGNYTTDFFITMSGMSQASFVGDGCYLAGYYPSFKAWVKIPLDGFTVENGKVYPVITSAGFDFKYTDICGTVGQFICGIYLTPEVLAANPNLTVDLTLGLAENKDAALNTQFLKVDNYVYDVDDLVTLPEVVITDIKNTLTDADPDLTFALNFAIKDVDKLSEEYLEKLFAKYGDYYTDYVLTISGLTDPNGSVKFNANGNGDGHLAGQYDAWSTNWVTVPFSDVTVTNGQSFYIMEYAAELMNKGGLRLTLKEIAEIVKNFDCGVYFTPEFLAANPNLKVELELKVFTEDENGNKVGDISVATNTFDKDDFSVEAAKLDIRIVNGKPQIGFAGEGKLVLNAATALTGEWTKNIEYTLVENDGDDTKTWVTPAEGYYFFKGFITK